MQAMKWAFVFIMVDCFAENIGNPIQESLDPSPEIASPCFKMVSQKSDALQELCSDESNSSNLVKINYEATCFYDLLKLYPDFEIGGHFKPKDCLARYKVAIIVPYRNRVAQLRAFLHNLHGFLRQQNLDYAIFVVEQVANQTFNRGKLLNIGAVESAKLYDWHCFVFHDVDLYPEDGRNLYSCPNMPTHLSAYIDRQNYKLLYADQFGGAASMSRSHFHLVNGYSNDFWGWGGEDDEMAYRLHANGLNITRYPEEISRYKMMGHSLEQSNPLNPCRWSLMQNNEQQFTSDGLNSLKYMVHGVLLYPLFTKIVVDLLEKEERQRLYQRNVCHNEKSTVEKLGSWLRLL